MLRLRDLLLICVIVAAVGMGVYELGHNVDRTSNGLAQHDQELNQQVVRPTHKSGPSRRTIELAAGGIGGAAGVMFLISFVSALSRPGRRKTTWRAS